MAWPGRAQDRLGVYCARRGSGFIAIANHNWCVGRGYIADDPTKGLAAFDTTPQTQRRAMTREEIGKLLASCAPHRRLLYEVAFCTGLRAKELRRLRKAHLDTRRGGLRLDAEWTKNRKPGFQPLPKSLVARLAEFADGSGAAEFYRQCYAQAGASPEGIPKDPLLYVPSHTARDLEKDLEAAGIPKWQPGEGKIDFHACRVAYITFIVESGVTAKEAQELARHATSDLTMNVYARTRPERLTEAVEAVGEIVSAPAENAHSRHLMAAGAEGVDITALPQGGLCRGEEGGGGGNRTRVPWHFDVSFYAHS